MRISDKIKNKPSKERAEIKSTEIAKLDHKGKFTIGDIEVEILSLDKIDGGVEVYAKAWKNGKQLGWGNGVEIERFRIFNPPVLVDDPNGDIVREFNDVEGNPKQRKLREDPIQAIRETLVHTIKVSGKENANIIKGKVGRTTDTFYPAAGETEPVDGICRRRHGDDPDPGYMSWSEVREGSGTLARNTRTTDSVVIQGDDTTDKWRNMHRQIFGFDTSGIGSGASIDSATFSLYGSGNQDDYSQDVVIDRNPPSSASAIAAGDYDLSGWDETKQSDTTISCGSWNTSDYNDFTLNATGEGNVNLTGNSWFGTRLSGDFDDTEPTWSNDGRSYTASYMADETGTSSDPKLVVTYTVPQTLYATITETLNLTDTLSKKANYPVTVSDSMGIDDVVGKQGNLSDERDETHNLTDSKKCKIKKIISDGAIGW